jgi:hypothetical protein
MTGDAGHDRFVFSGSNGNDRIGDFARGCDKIDLASYGAIFVDLVIATSGSDTVIDLGATFADAGTITLQGIGTGLTADDFLLS